jgi:hypothetical protein
MTDFAQQEGPDLAPIFSGPVRWGFEPVPPRPVQRSPERDRPPSLRAPTTISAAAGTGAGQITTAIFAAAAITLVLDIVAIAANTAALISLVALAGAGASVWATAAFRSKANLGQPGVFEAIRIGLLSLFIPPLGLLVQGLIARARTAHLRQQQVPDTRDLAAAQGDYERAMVDWRRRVTEFESSEQKRVDEARHWYPVVPSPGSHLICAFGGSSLTWADALLTLGGSMLGSGKRVSIVDVSRRRSVDELWDLARRHGYPVYPESVPSDTPMLPTLEEMNWDSLTDILSEVSQSAQRDAALRRHERQEDRAVLREVAGCLDQHAPVSITRLEAALHIVASAGVPQGNGGLSDEEYDRLSVLYNDVQRQHGGVMERVTRLERLLRGLPALEQPAGELDRAAGEPHSALRVASIDKKADELDSEIVSDLFVQLLLRSMRDGAVSADFLILLGADRVSKTSLDSLSTYAEREKLPAFLFFEHLRDDAVEVIGGGGAAAAFFTLANHREAQEAVSFIGSEFKWMESQHTRAYSQSVTRSRGTERSESVGHSFTRGFSAGSSVGRYGTTTTTSTQRSATDSHSTTVGQSQSHAIGDSQERSTSEQRVREAVIEPEVLMGIAVTGMIYVEVQPGGQRITANVDCNPEINYAPRVSKEPRGHPSQGKATPP